MLDRTVGRWTFTQYAISLSEERGVLTAGRFHLTALTKRVF